MQYIFGKFKIKNMTRSKIFNFLLLYIFTISFFLYSISPVNASGASLYLSPASGTKVINSSFRVSVMVNSGGEPINAAEGTISYDANLLEAVSVSKGNIFMFWTTEPSIGGGSIKFGGGNPSPYTGTSGHVITITFKAKKAGTAQIRFTSGAVLANDGKGTNILASMGSGSYIISPKVEAPDISSGSTNNANNKPAAKVESEYNKPIIKSSTHADQNKWYQDDNIKFFWDLPSGIKGVSIDFNQKPVSDPGPKSDGLFSEKEFKSSKSGIWYLHLKFKDSSRWGTVAHFRVMIDKNPPKPFEIKVNNIEVGELPVLEFETSDEESGLDRYEIYVGSLEHQAHKLSADKKSIELSALEAGSHTVLVKAIDKAGNQRVETVEFVIDPIPTPVITNYQKEIKPDDKFYMSGTAIPGSRIIVFVEQDRRVIASTSVMTDANGNWFYIHNKKLTNGRYTSFVIAINDKGIRSGESSRISFLVSPPVFAVVGSFIINYFTVIVSLIFMIALIVLIIFFLIFFARKKLRKETIEVEEVLKRNLKSFRQELDDEFVGIIKKETRITGKKDKKMIKDKLDKKLDSIERKIMKEVQDVEDILK